MHSVTSQLLLVFMLALSMVFAAVPNTAHFSFNLRTQNEDTSESIEIHFRENYVKITTQGNGDVQPSVMIHEYTQDLNMFKQNEQCFLMDKFDDIPETIEGWMLMQKTMIKDTVAVDGDVIYKDYQYKALPFQLDRSTLPAVIQNTCPGAIHVLVLQETLEGDEQARVALGDNTGAGEILLPGQILKKRVKRQSGWGGGLSGGRDGQGGYVNGNVHGNNGRGTSGSLSGGYHFGTRDYNLGGSLSHSSGSWTGTARGSHHSSGGSSLGGSLGYNRGGLGAGLSVDHNLRTHNTNLGGTLDYNRGSFSAGVGAGYNTGTRQPNVQARLRWTF